MLITYKKGTTRVSIRVGDKLQLIEDGRIGILKLIEVVSNNTNDDLIARLTIKILYTHNTVMATADKFSPVEGEQYLHP